MQASVETDRLCFTAQHRVTVYSRVFPLICVLLHVTIFGNKVWFLVTSAIKVQSNSKGVAIVFFQKKN